MVPLLVGGRVLGRSGPWQVGALSMETNDVPSANVPMTNYSVLRVNRDVLSRSRIGLVATSRRPSSGATPNNYAGGVDAQFNLLSDIFINAYWAKTQTDGKDRNDPGQ